MLDHLIAVRGAFVQQWRALRSEGADWLELVNTIPMVVVIAWIAGQSGRLSVTTYLAIGVFFLVLLDRSHLGLRYSITGEAWAGTLDFTMLSPAPLMAILMGKALAHTLSSARPALAAFVVALVVTGGIGEVASVPWAVLSTLVSLLALVSIAFAQAPATVLAGRQLGAIRSTRSIMTALGGFLYPVSLLPGPIGFLARLLPTSWGMGALVESIERGGTPETVLNLLVAVALSFGYLALAAWMFVKVEARVRALGAAVTRG